jgi:hypothetical protein
MRFPKSQQRRRSDDGCSDCWFGCHDSGFEAIHAAAFLGMFRLGYSAVPSSVLGSTHVTFQEREAREEMMSTTQSNQTLHRTANCPRVLPLSFLFHTSDFGGR